MLRILLVEERNLGLVSTPDGVPLGLVERDRRTCARPDRSLCRSAAVVALFPARAALALFIVVALELARAGLRTDAPIPTLVVALVSLVTPLTVEFVVGWIILAVLARWRLRRPRSAELV